MGAYRFVVKYRWWLIATLATLFFLFAGYEFSILPDAIADKCKQPNSASKNNCPGYIVTGIFLDIVATYLKPYSDVLTALSGLAVAGFTFTLWLTTRKMWRTAEDQIEVANRTVDSMIGTERARLYVVIEDDRVTGALRRAAEMWTHEDSDPMHLSGVGLAYSFKNYGKTPAFIHMIGHRVLVVGDLPSERDYSILVPVPVDHLLEPGKKTVPIPVQLPRLTVATAKSISSIEATFWFYGYIRYDDAFGNRWRLDYIWHYSAVSNGFRTFRYRETKEEN